MTHRPALTIVLLPDGQGGPGEPRTIRLSTWRIRFFYGIGVVLLLLLLTFLGSWIYFAVRSSRVAELEAEVAVLREDQARVAELARQFSEVEAQYEHLRSLFGSDTLQAGGAVWLPPAGGGSGGRGGGPPGAGEELPSSWPLTQRGFITQPLLEGAGGEHPGVDVAVPSGSYIRAAGAGTVAEVGEDPVYGYFVVLDHGGGYRSLYAHASLLLVDGGAEVRRNEVIGLTGSSGRSTAPHLHFEILRDGEPVDPLTMVTPP